MKLIVRNYKATIGWNKTAVAALKELDFDELDYTCSEGGPEPAEEGESRYTAVIEFKHLPVTTSTSYREGKNACNDGWSSSSSSTGGWTLEARIDTTWNKPISMDDFKKSMRTWLQNSLEKTVERGLPFVLDGNGSNLEFNMIVCIDGRMMMASTKDVSIAFWMSGHY